MVEHKKPALSPLEVSILDYIDAVPPILRTPDVIESERELNSALRPWARNHRDRYKSKGFGVLPRIPGLFRDQQITQTGRGLSVLRHLMPEGKYHKLHKGLYAKTVGSPEVAESIINKFKETPAFADMAGSPNIVDYVVSKIKDRENGKVGNSIAIATGHLDRLTDVAEFTGGLSLAIMEEHGSTYAERFKVIVNKLMTQETIHHIPAAWLGAISLQPRWGLPHIGAEKWGISEEAEQRVNGWLAKTFVEEISKAGEVWGIVPAGSAALLTKSDQRIEAIEIPHSMETAGLYTRCAGGIIVANRLGSETTIGSVIPVAKPAELTSRDYTKVLIDKINREIALQASKLGGNIPVTYKEVGGQDSPKMITVLAGQDRSQSEPSLTSTGSLL